MYKQVRQLSGLAYIPTCRSPSPQMVYNTARHRASGGIFLTRSATVGQVCRTGLTPSNVLSIFQFHPTKFQPDRANGVRDMRYQSFSLFGVDFDHIRSSKVNLTLPMESPWVLRSSAPRRPTSYLSPFSRYFESKCWLLTFWPWLRNP